MINMLKTLDFKGNFDKIAQQFSSRKEEISKQVNDSVMDIIDDVRVNGDKAIIKYCEKFDGFKIENPSDLITSRQEIMAGVTIAGKDFIRILERTKEKVNSSTR